MEEITRVLRQRHRIGPGAPDDFAVRDFTEVVHAVKGTVGLVAGLLLCGPGKCHSPTHPSQPRPRRAP